eukprot:GFUD01131811.1.p1 GENE.GFUD01131811.1~~GFUD01131811.1.p1  ORF type:complete len:166 (-),score=35.95 GFUD01131811.1:19-516(-)
MMQSNLQHLFTFLAILGLSTALSLPERAGVAGEGFGTIQRISILTADCTDCGMTLLGQVNLKICGGTPEPCCSIVNIGDFDSNMFTEGVLDNYVGDHQLEDCFNYSLDKVTSPADLGLTVYHEGSDGGQLDWIEVTTEHSTVRCVLGYWMDGFSSFDAYNCAVMP